MGSSQKSPRHASSGTNVCKVPNMSERHLPSHNNKKAHINLRKLRGNELGSWKNPKVEGREEKGRGERGEMRGKGR